MDTGLNFETIRQQVNEAGWEESEYHDDQEERRVFLGTVFALTPSGKFYTPFANGNVTEEEAQQDIEWYDTVSAELEKVGLYLAHGEGDPCDLFAVESRDTEES